MPWLDGAAVERRLRDVAADVVPQPALDNIVGLADRLWDLPDCQELFAALAAARPLSRSPV